jgi:hypothetical protein
MLAALLARVLALRAFLKHLFDARRGHAASVALSRMRGLHQQTLESVHVFMTAPAADGAARSSSCSFCGLLTGTPVDSHGHATLTDFFVFRRRIRLVIASACRQPARSRGDLCSRRDPAVEAHVRKPPFSDLSRSRPPTSVALPRRPRPGLTRPEMVRFRDSRW